MALEGPILAATIRNLNIPTRTSTLFCNILFGLCDVPAVSNFTVPFPKPKPKTSRPAVSGKSAIQIVHISDVHVDLSYEVGSNYNCTVSLITKI
jgi:sphingomyelin phosphodiesterase